MLMNVISERELETPDFVEFFENDILQECSKYGSIISHYIPRPEKRGQQVACAGRVFVEYSSLSAAERAQQALSGRRYNYRCVVTSFYSEELYAQRTFVDDSTRPIYAPDHQGEANADNNYNSDSQHHSNNNNNNNNDDSYGNDEQNPIDMHQPQDPNWQDRLPANYYH
jgi:hypothetical protein